jgi:hypothetical protein
MKQYRVFFHYRKSTNGMTVHFRGKCIPTKNVECKVPVETKYIETQPRLVLRGYCNQIVEQENKIIIQ